jgi:phosphoribosylanthranilate isomerase
MTKVKICGITNLEDAVLVANLGADFAGLNFYKESPRKISAQMARDIVSKLPKFITPIGVFVDEELSVVLKAVKKLGLGVIQLHGSETPEYCGHIKAVTPVQIIKAFRICDEQALAAIPAYLGVIDQILLDACVEGQPGGTGEQFNWDLAIKAKEFGKPIFLAGGLTPENVLDAIKKVDPFAVDVATGVERLPRRKDYQKTMNFIKRARGL